MFPGRFLLFGIRKTCHDWCMANTTQLRDFYTFPGFVPNTHIPPHPIACNSTNRL